MVNDLSAIEGFLIDLDGTLYIGNKLIKGADKFIKYLKMNNIPFLIISNNSSLSTYNYQEKLLGMGIIVDESQIITSTIATINYLKINYPNHTIYPIGTPEFENELTVNGIKIDKNEGDIVLLGFDKTFTYGKLTKGVQLISNGAIFIATHSDILCPVENGYIPDIGTLIASIEIATGRSPKIIGKPNIEIFEFAINKLGLSKEKVAMIGDRIYTDIKLANNYGLKSILVLSGETNIDKLDKIDIIPDFVFDSVMDIAQRLHSLSSN